MAKRSDFVWVLVDAHLGNNENDIGASTRQGFKWEGQSVEKPFTIEGTPVVASLPLADEAVPVQNSLLVRSRSHRNLITFSQ